MTNRQFDDLVRRRIETEAMSMHKESENRIIQAMGRPETRQAARRFTMRSLAVAILVLALLCGVALAAVNWGTREYLTYTDDDGQQHINENLAGYVQPVGKTFEGDILKIDMIDAIFDGRSVILAWTLENKSDQELYILCEALYNGEYGGQGSTSNVGEYFIKPGEVVTAGLTSFFEGEDAVIDWEACDVSMKFMALAPTGEVVEIGYHDAETEAEYAAYDEKVNALNAEGKLVLEPDGYINVGNRTTYQEGMSYADMLIDSGAMTLADEVPVELSLARNATVTSANAVQGKLTEKDNGDYILRVVRAEMTPNSAVFEVECVFKDRAAVEKYSEYFDTSVKLRPYWGFSFADETGDVWWMQNGGGSGDEEPLEMDDGSFVWRYTATMTSLVRTPKEITITPQRDDVVTGEYVEFPEEAVTVVF